MARLHNNCFRHNLCNGCTLGRNVLYFKGDLQAGGDGMGILDRCDLFVESDLFWNIKAIFYLIALNCLIFFLIKNSRKP